MGGNSGASLMAAAAAAAAAESLSHGKTNEVIMKKEHGLYYSRLLIYIIIYA